MLARAIMDWNRGVERLKERLIRGWERELVAISLWQALVVIIVQSFRGKKNIQSFYISMTL
jgi:hypothetical protein